MVTVILSGTQWSRRISHKVWYCKREILVNYSKYFDILVSNY